MQYASKLYKARGGRYKGRKRADNRLTQWTRQDWTTKSGRPSRETGERYLPRAAIESLSSAEYGATSRAKRAGGGVGSVVAQPQSIREKTRKFRKVNPMKAKSATPAQIAARKKFAERARSGELAKMRKKSTPRKARAVKSNPIRDEYGFENFIIYTNGAIWYIYDRKKDFTDTGYSIFQRKSGSEVFDRFTGEYVKMPRNRYSLAARQDEFLQDLIDVTNVDKINRAEEMRRRNPAATRAPARSRTKLVSNGREKNPKVRVSDVAGKSVPEYKVAYSVHLADQPSYHGLAYFTKKAQAIEAAQEVADRRGIKMAVSRTQIHFGPK
jgi:hypothetical protein